MKKMKKLAVALLSLIILFGGNSALAQSSLYGDEQAQAELVLRKIEEYFPKDHATMKAIAYCETRSRPFVHWEANGQLRPNAGGASSAGGAFQVLLKLHRKEIQALGLNMQNIDDYMTFVKHLHSQGRFQPWNASRHCWKSRVHRFT